MIQRRNALRGSGGKIPSMTEESGMRHFIEVRVYCTARKIPHVYAIDRTLLSWKGAPISLH